jgi:hypothetical protein
MIINGIVGDAYITVSGGSAPVQHVAPNGNNPMQGMLRINNTDIQVFDGNTWRSVSTGWAAITLNPVYQETLHWAQKKMHEEKEMLRLAEKHASVKIALDNLNKAKQQLDVTIILSNEHNESTS